MATSLGYRENPSRCIYLNAVINQDLVSRITPVLNELRHASGDPITAYIDSPGGSTNSANIIRRLATAPTAEGRRCRLITVVTGAAKSAAADFVTFSNYAYAHGHTELLFHGVRLNPDQTLTFEEAKALAADLQESNEHYAIQLAKANFQRFIFRMSQFGKELAEYRNSTPGSHGASLKQVLEVFKSRLSSRNVRLVRLAYQKQQSIEELSKSIDRWMSRIKNIGRYTRNEFEAAIFKAIVNYKSRVHSPDKSEWLLSQTGMREVTEDFNLLADFFWGRHVEDVGMLLDTYGELLLSDEDQKSYRSLTETEEVKKKWLYQHANGALQPLWYFVVSMCRLLQTADYTFTAREAYWLGFVDEVPGTSLPNFRTLAEAEAAKPSSPNASPPLI
jgi:ATP-dependent protease ClpP protease subunit